MDKDISVKGVTMEAMELVPLFSVYLRDPDSNLIEISNSVMSG
jgi:hypothetical protein